MPLLHKVLATNKPAFIFVMTYKCQNMKNTDSQWWIIAGLLSPAELRIHNNYGYIIHILDYIRRPVKRG